MSLRAIIADDEAPARDLLIELLAAHKDIDVVGTAATGFDAVKLINELTPDVVFLDIQMPRLDGFEVVELVGASVSVVFVTAYDEHAVRAFEHDAVDYLLKPFSTTRLAKALERVRERKATGTPPKLTQNVRGAYLDRIVVRDGAKVDIVQVSDLRYAMAQGDYVELHVTNRSLLKNQTLQSLETALDPERFVRIHRSYIVSLGHIARIELIAKDAHEAVLRGGERLPVSRTGFKKIKRL